MRLFLLATTLLVALAGAAHAQDRVRVGVLECRGGTSVGFVVGSVTNLGCVLRVEGMPEDRYIATIRKVGLDLGITEETALAWGVYAPVARLGPGDLSGNYAGAQGSASLGVGAGGNMLIGGSNNTIALQPLAHVTRPPWIDRCVIYEKLARMRNRSHSLRSKDDRFNGVCIGDAQQYGFAGHCSVRR